MKKRVFIAALFLSLFCFLGCHSDAAQPGADPAPQPTDASGNVLQEVLTEAPTAAPTAVPTPTPVTVHGQAVSPDTEVLTLEGAVEGPAALGDELKQLKLLKTVTLDRTVPSMDLAAWRQEWATLEAELPHVTFSFRDLYEGAPTQTVSSFAVRSLPDDPEGEIRIILDTFGALEELDLSALPLDRERVIEIQALAPRIAICWNDAAFGPSRSDAETLTFSAPAQLDEVQRYIKCFPRLQTADVLALGLSEQEGDVLAQAFPAVAFRRMVTLNGVARDNFVEELDLSYAKIRNYTAFCDEVGRFPRLRKLEMSFCTLTNEELAALRSRYPQAGVAWTMKVRGRHLRSDAVAFSSKQLWDNTHRYTNKDCEVFKYCDKLIALDLGHNAISDLTWLESLSDLQLLILADNKIKDLTPLTKLKKLKYVEIFMNPITDISPLGELTELVDVNVCFCFAGGIRDISPLSNCKKLERIWLTGNKHISQASLAELQAALPDAYISYTNGSGSTGDGWREHPRYDAYIEMFKKNIPVAPFLPEE